MTLIKKLWLGIAVLIIITPLGLILPDYFKAGGAWEKRKFPISGTLPCLIIFQRLGR